MTPMSTDGPSHIQLMISKRSVHQHRGETAIKTANNTTELGMLIENRKSCSKTENRFYFFGNWFSNSSPFIKETA